jgi:hypothetical protein
MERGEMQRIRRASDTDGYQATIKRLTGGSATVNLELPMHPTPIV